MTRPRFGFEVVFPNVPPIVVVAVDKRAAEVRAAMDAYPNGNMTSWQAITAEKITKVKVKPGKVVR